MERKLYKTKLCILFERGRCSRQSCSFAHGEAELRRLPGSFSGRREYRGGDLRDRLDRRRSPYRRYSPGRDFRGRPAFYGQKQAPRDRGYSPSRSPIRRSERRHFRKQHLEGESDDSRSPKFSDDDDRPKERKAYSDDEKDDLGEKLKELESEIEHLDESKHQLEMDLREKDQEADKLTVHIQQLEFQLSQEREDCRRFISKNKKFIKALGRYTRAQDELKRSQIRLQKLADQLGSDGLKSGANEEDSSINIISDGELNHGGRQETDNHASPLKKRARLSSGSSKNRERFFESTSDRPIAQSDNSRKEADMSNTVLLKNEVCKVFADDPTHKTGKNGILLAGLDKGKILERGNLLLPSTSMAAHAVDELAEAVETDDKSEGAEAGIISQNGVAESKTGLPFLPPLPLKVTSNAYNQYEDDDEEVDVVEVGNEAGDVDMNDENM